MHKRFHEQLAAADESIIVISPVNGKDTKLKSQILSVKKKDIHSRAGVFGLCVFFPSILDIKFGYIADTGCGEVEKSDNECT